MLLQAAAAEGKMQMSRSFPVFKAFLRTLLDVVCRANGDVEAAFNALKSANKTMGVLKDEGEVSEHHHDRGEQGTERGGLI